MTHSKALTIQCYLNGRKTVVLTFTQTLIGSQTMHELIADGVQIVATSGGQDCWISDITPEFVLNFYAAYLESLAADYKNADFEIL